MYEFPLETTESGKSNFLCTQILKHIQRIPTHRSLICWYWFIQNTFSQSAHLNSLSILKPHKQQHDLSLHLLSVFTYSWLTFTIFLSHTVKTFPHNLFLSLLLCSTFCSLFSLKRNCSIDLVKYFIIFSERMSRLFHCFLLNFSSGTF